MSSTRKRRGQFLFAALLLIVAILIFFSWDPTSQEPNPRKSSTEDNQVLEAPEPSHLSLRPEVVPVPETSESAPDEARKGSPPHWQSSLRESLLAQGGDDVEALEITPLESRVWVHEGRSLNVETARVSFKEPGGNVVTFKVMVDQETGQVLQTWDQPVVDEFFRKNGSGVKLDPRYLGQ